VNAVVSDDDPNTFYGGGKKWIANQEVGTDSVHLTKYVWKTNHSYMPNVPVEMPGQKTLALQNNISMLGLKNPFVGETLEGSLRTCVVNSKQEILLWRPRSKRRTTQDYTTAPTFPLPVPQSNSTSSSQARSIPKNCVALLNRRTCCT